MGLERGEQKMNTTRAFSLACLCLALLISVSYSIITLGVPTNNSIIYGSAVIFNWTDNSSGCIGMNFFLAKGATTYANISELGCNDTFTLNNLTTGNYVWNLTSTDAISEISETRYFSINAIINATIIYPHSLTGFYQIGPGQCTGQVIVQTNYSGDTPNGTTCRLYSSNKTLLQTLSSASMNATYTFTFSTSGIYYTNCTASTSSDSNNTKTEGYDVQAVGLCDIEKKFDAIRPPNDNTPWLLALGYLILLGLVLTQSGKKPKFSKKISY